MNMQIKTTFTADELIDFALSKIPTTKGLEIKRSSISDASVNVHCMSEGTTENLKGTQECCEIVVNLL